MWLKFVVRSRLTEDRDYFFRVMSMADTVFLYIKSSTGKYHERRTGYDLKRDEKDIVYKSWDAFKIRFNQTGEQEFYVRLTGEDEIAIPYPAVVSMDKITVYSSTERMAISLLGGMILLMALYYLVLFFTSREKNYLFYSLFVMGFGFYLLDNWGYLGELPRPWLYHLTVDYMELVFALPVILFSLFTISYLELRKTLPVWFRLFQVNIGIIILTSMILIAFWLFSDKYPDLVYYPYRISTYLISGILILTTTVLRLRKKYKPAWYFLAASLAMIVLIAFYQQTDMEFSSDTLYASNLGVVLKNAGLHIGAVVQFLIFSIGLGQKMRHMEIARKKAQQRIIEQLRENEKLKDKVNRELEQKVQERTREIMEQKEEIEAQRDEIQLQRDVVTAQKQEIMDSIGYAKRIQNAVLPHREYLDEVMPDYFVLFRPRDVVSGDFYWVREVKNYLVVVAADCTGHGVPGAFMSMLGVSLLNEIVGKSRFDSPGEILNRLRKKIKETLTQEGKAHEQKDGMDMALVILDKESMELQYAGAYNPLYIFRTKDGQQGTLQDHPVTMENDLFQLFELKADRQPISIHEIETDFSTRTVRLQKGDTLYAFSDGYVDQRGGPRQKKFLSKNFKRFLLEIQPLTMQEQEETVADTLDDWMREIEQVDDILVMGIRV
jgi:serine phosphatase RsbU (regulator of sigma subunit)